MASASASAPPQEGHREPPYPAEQGAAHEEGSRDIGATRGGSAPSPGVVVEREPVQVPDYELWNLVEREMADIAREYGGQAYEYFDLLRARVRQHLNLPVTGHI